MYQSCWYELFTAFCSIHQAINICTAYNYYAYYVSNGKDEGFSEESDCVKLSINALPMPGWLPWLLPRIAVTSSSVPPFLSLPLS